MHLFNKQFIISGTKEKIDDTWEYLAINEEWVLSYSNNLCVQRITNKENKSWLLIGVAVQSDSKLAAPELQINLSETSQIPSICASWSGRWLLVGDGRIYMDACGLLGCYYYQDMNISIISSSTALIRKIIEEKSGTILMRRAPLIKGEGMDWYAPPSTGFINLHKLLPSQYIQLISGKIKVGYKKLLQMPLQVLNYEETIRQLSDKFVHIMKELYKKNNKIWLSLTAGRDTRLLLAACLKANIPFETYTQDYPLITDGDRQLPFTFAAEYGFSHHLIKRKKISLKHEKLFDSHTDSQTVDADRMFFSYQQWESVIPANAILLRGSVFGLAKIFYLKKFYNIDINSPSASADILNTFHHKDPKKINELEAWIHWIIQYPEIEWKDRFYMEVREGGWLSAIEQGLDLTEYTSINPVNCADIISLFLSTPEEKRINKNVHNDIISLLQPDLLRYPYNPRNPLFKRIYLKSKRYLGFK